jgi:hypothetical protein
MDRARRLSKLYVKVWAQRRDAVRIVDWVMKLLVPVGPALSAPCMHRTARFTFDMDNISTATAFPPHVPSRPSLPLLFSSLTILFLFFFLPHSLGFNSLLGYCLVLRRSAPPLTPQYFLRQLHSISRSHGSLRPESYTDPLCYFDVDNCHHHLHSCCADSIRW